MSRQTRAALAAIVGAAFGLALVAAAVIVLRDGDGSSGPETAPPPAATETPETGETGPAETEETVFERTRTVDVGGFPNAVAVGGGGAFVVRDGRRLIRIDPDTATVVARIGAGDEIGTQRPCGVAFGLQTVWVTTVSGDLARISPRTNRLARIIDLDEAACVAVGAGAVWVTAPNSGLVVRIDPETNEVVETIGVGGFPQGIGVGFGGVWVASGDPPSGEEGGVSRIDPATGEVVATIPVTGVPEFLAVGAGGVWVTADDGTVRFLDPRTRELGTPIQVAEGGRTAVAVGGGSVWATALTGPDVIGTAVRIDPATRAVTGEAIPVGEGPVGLAFGAGSLWVANSASGTVTIYTP